MSKWIISEPPNKPIMDMGFKFQVILENEFVKIEVPITEELARKYQVIVTNKIHPPYPDNFCIREKYHSEPKRHVIELNWVLEKDNAPKQE